MSLYSYTFHHWNNSLGTKTLPHGNSGIFKLSYTAVLDWGKLSFTQFFEFKGYYVGMSWSWCFSLTNTSKHKLWLFPLFVYNIVPFSVPLVQVPLRRQMLIIKDPYYSTNLGFVLKAVVQCRIDCECPEGHKGQSHQPLLVSEQEDGQYFCCSLHRPSWDP